MTESERIKYALVNVITMATHSDYYNKDRDDQDIDLIEEIVKKAIPMKPIDIQTPVVTWGLCPVCKGEYRKLGKKPNRVFLSDKYCPDCGQRLDWSDIEDEIQV